MLSNNDRLSKVEACSDIATLVKIATFEGLKKSYLSYLKQMDYRRARNAKVQRLYRLAVEAGLDK